MFTGLGVGYGRYFGKGIFSGFDSASARDWVSGGAGSSLGCLLTFRRQEYLTNALGVLVWMVEDVQGFRLEIGGEEFLEMLLVEVFLTVVLLKVVFPEESWKKPL